MELKLNSITPKALAPDTYIAELECSFKNNSDGTAAPHYARISIILSKTQIDGLTLVEIEETAKAVARQLFS